VTRSEACFHPRLHARAGGSTSNIGEHFAPSTRSMGERFAPSSDELLERFHIERWKVSQRFGPGALVPDVGKIVLVGMAARRRHTNPGAALAVLDVDVEADLPK
jgi:hypothetical protein